MYPVHIHTQPNVHNAMNQATKVWHLMLVTPKQKDLYSSFVYAHKKPICNNFQGCMHTSLDVINDEY